MEIREIKVSEIRGWSENPRKMSRAAREGLKRSIDRFGMVQPIVVNKRVKVGFEIVSGHQRFDLLLKKGEKKVQAVVVDIDPREAKALAISLNNRMIQGDWTSGVEKIIEEIRGKIGREDEIALRIEDLRMEISKGKKDEREDPVGVDVSPELMEAHNYLVFYFDNMLDWQVIVERFGIKTVKTKDSRKGYLRMGIGRVLKGSTLIEKTGGRR